MQTGNLNNIQETSLDSNPQPEPESKNMKKEKEKYEKRT